jgi:superfamily I DNA/RNA helicase
MRRVARLLEQGAPPESILLISFTRTAAHDLRTKVANLGVPGAEDVRATTLHAYCFSLLMREAVLAITRRTPRPLLEHEADMMLRDIPGDHGDIEAKRERLRAYEAGWARSASDHPGLGEPDDQEFEGAVLRWLKHHKAMLIGEVVPIAHAYLRDNPMSEEHGRYEHLVVDEYQDLNSLEQRLLDVIAEQGDLCIAGDDDQSIYGFRYANPEGIVGFREREDVDCVEIEVCGRCPRVILNMANELIGHAPERRKEPLHALQDVDGTVAVVQWADLDEEVQGVTAAIAGAVQQGRREPGEILVLVHRQRIGEMIRRRLTELGVPAHSFFSQESVLAEEARRALALLRMAVGEDRVSLRVILGLGDSTARAAAYRRLSDYCTEQGRIEQEVLEALRGGERLPVRVPAFVERYEAAIAFVNALPRDDLVAAVEQLFPPDVEELADLRAIALEEVGEAEDLADLTKLIVTRVTQHDVPESPDFVRIMSLHKSKGLTSPVVFLAGMVDGIVPTIPARLDEVAAEAAVHEQRRLVYVAVTRASEELIISSSSQMELGLANGLGVRVVRDGIRRVAGQLIAPTIASPYLREMSESAPRALRGLNWIRESTA